MTSTTPDAPTLAERLSSLAMERFPLVARPQPICRAPSTRVAQIRTRAEQAALGGKDALLRGAEALNLAALLASDCGVDVLARELCWRQFDAFAAARPLSASVAQLALQALINLARLHTRAGDGQKAFDILNALSNAVRSHTAVEIDGRNVDFDGFVSSAEDEREIREWLWSVLLADGMRALARAGHWDQALAHAERLHGIGDHLGEGRQIAIVAHCVNGTPSTALDLVKGSALSEPWERAVAACLTTFCHRVIDQPAGDTDQEMVERCLGLSHEPNLATFNARLGLTALGLLDSGNEEGSTLLRQWLVDLALEPGYGYAAREALADSRFTHGLSRSQQENLSETVRELGLGHGTIPHELINTVEACVHTMAASLCGIPHHDPARRLMLRRDPTPDGSSTAPSVADNKPNAAMGVSRSGEIGQHG